MAQFESIEPTDLLKRIRSGEAVEIDRIAAANVAFFLGPYIQSVVDLCLRNTLPDHASIAKREKLAEITMTGLQLALEDQADILDQYAHPKPVDLNLFAHRSVS